MSTESNKQLVLEFLQLLDARDYDSAFELFDDEAEVWVAGDPEMLPGAGKKSPREFKELLQLTSTLSSSGLKTTIIDCIAEGDKVALESEAFGHLDNGSTYFNQYHFVFRVRDNKIVVMKEYFDTLRALSYAQSLQQ